MSKPDTQTLKKLEYDKILSLLAAEASSKSGRQKCLTLRPMTDIAAANAAQEETAAALFRITAGGRPSFDGCEDTDDILRRLTLGAPLNCAELLRVKRLLETAAAVKSYGAVTEKKEGDEKSGGEGDEKPGGEDERGDARDCLDEYFRRLSPLTGVAGEIRRIVISDDEVADDASPKLRRIRLKIASANEKIRSTLTSLAAGSASEYLQNGIVTMRGDRYCLPVKAQYKNKIDGIVHDRSATGSTLFIEPVSIVRLNNEIGALIAMEKEEINVILEKLSASVGEHGDEIAEDFTVLSRLDFIFAKASLALKTDAARPALNIDGIIDIRQGRHPLLERKSAVPISLPLGEDYDILVVTGPNTGGKTVTLKTVGLLTLMAQSGLHIPAGEGSRMAVFENIFADIGDEQSIEQSLSTFSSHMLNIVSILKKADENSLVLLDELGAGTDPAEGAALAVSILSYLLRLHTRVIATTHYSEVKIFALTTPGVENAGCEFDLETLRPTYRLLIGVPGKSNAFAISEKLGLPENIINDAKSRLTEREKSFEDLLTDLEKERAAAEEERKKIEALRADTENERLSLTREREKFDSEKSRIIQTANEKASLILREAKDAADKCMRQVRKAESGRISASDLEGARTEVRKKLNEASEASAKSERKSSHTKDAPMRQARKADDLRPGDTVYSHSLGIKCVVVSSLDAKGNVTVRAGLLSSRLPVSDLDIISEADPGDMKNVPGNKMTPGSRTKDDAALGWRGEDYAKSRASYTNISSEKARSVSSEINLIGKTADEAVSALEKYLDDACLSGLNQVRIVHGKGTGALRMAVENLLKRLPYVKSFRRGEYGEGDFGVTIATLG